MSNAHGSTGIFLSERATFEAHRAEWLPTCEGMWVAIHGADVKGPMGAFRDAWLAGSETWADGTFMVRQVTSVDRPIVISHMRRG